MCERYEEEAEPDFEDKEDNYKQAFPDERDHVVCVLHKLCLTPKIEEQSQRQPFQNKMYCLK